MAPNPTPTIETKTAPAAPSAKPAKKVQITLIGKQSHVVHGKQLEAGPTVYSDLGWSPEQWADAKKDPHVVIEPLDDNGKVFVPRRDREGKVVQPGDEGRAIAKKQVGPTTDDEDNA